jgi:uncharacterized protein involved in exopolysaccharide biosynthesis
MIITADRYDAETARLASLETALAGALAEQAQTSTLSRNAGTDTSVDVNQSTAVQGLRAELARSETKLSEISAIVGSSHPTRIQLEAQIAELKKQIASEQRRVSGTTQTANRISSQKIGELRALVEAQKRSVLDLRKQRDAGATLVKDLEVAQRAYDAVQSRRSQLTLESAADQAGARVLSPAIAPYEPSSPNIPKNMVAAVIVGLLLGVAAAMAWEFLDRRVRSEADMKDIDGVPVLSVLSAKPGRSALVRRLPPPRLPPQLTMSEGAG